MKTIIFIASLFLSVAAIGQRVLHCGYQPCSPSDMESIANLLSTKTSSDTTSAFHLKANFFAENKNNLDSAIYYLEKVISRDKNLINNLYAYSSWKTDYLGKKEHHYFVGRHPILEQLFVDLEWVSSNYESINGRSEFEEPFIKKINSLDQSTRLKIIEIESKINKHKIKDTLLTNLSNTVDSLYEVMKRNDKNVRELLTDKLVSDKSYFSNHFKNKERLVFSTVLLHAGEDLIELENFMVLMHKENIFSISQIGMIVGRHYCVRYNHSPTIKGSVHCDYDSNLEPILKNDFPKLATLLLN